MRITSSIVLAFAILAATPALAQTYDAAHPVCMKVYDGSFGGGEWIDCSYFSLPQCQATASGRAAMCVTNPYFAHARATKAARRVYR
ncbi:DUF3551 domain-containing protein [Bradyrhizobium sp.]|uniref:DUF3551 domain-containing protein n=1 Tax=Bradyrhizobium sp. TaxID=376 RepID=UPI004037AF38